MGVPDATSAKILVLLGIPAVLVAIALGLGAESRRRGVPTRRSALPAGATNRQLTRLAAMEAIPATVLGLAIGLLVGLAAAGAATGVAIWRVLTLGQIVSSSLIAGRRRHPHDGGALGSGWHGRAVASTSCNSAACSSTGGRRLRLRERPDVDLHRRAVWPPLPSVRSGRAQADAE